MAESAPMTTAYAHARRAGDGATKPELTVDEHGFAAHDYARAAKSTSDFEALRILKLLEEQHLRLANILKQQVSIEQISISAPNTIDSPPSATRNVTSSKERAPAGAMAATTHVGSGQTRDSSPSLAREIASRRGIPQPVRTSPSVVSQTKTRRLSPESRRHNRTVSTPNIPPSIMDSQNLTRTTKNNKAEEDDAFTKFYSNLTTGTMARLSSALAYAGLPLTSDDLQADQSAKQKSTRQTVSASNEPDVKKFFSKAALNAIEDEHRQRGARGHVFGPTESFYVVQAGGGTYSYADVAKVQQQQQQQQLLSIDDDDEEAFVDAREAQTSPRHSRRFANQPQVTSSSGRTHEELELENTTLKQTLEQLATRLTTFETHAQDASMAALTQSMANLVPPAGGVTQGDPATAERIRLLEQQLERQADDKQRLENLAAKQEKTLKKYKAQWGVLVSSAKEKEKAKREKADKSPEYNTKGAAD